MSDNTVIQETGNDVAGTEATQAEVPTENASETDVNNVQGNEDGKVTEADKNNETEPEKPQDQPFVLEMESLKLPEGVTVTDGDKAEFLKDVESLGINSQEGAQKFVDWLFEKAKASEDMLAKQQENQIDGLEKRWVDEGKRDPVLGKDYDKNVSDAMDLANQVFSPRTIDFLKDTKFDKNPDFLKDMLRLAKERADAELISGKPQVASTRTKRDSQGNPMLTFNS